MGILHIGSETVKEELRAIEEHRLFESVIPQYGFYFLIGKRILQDEPVNNADRFRVSSTL